MSYLIKPFMAIGTGKGLEARLTLQDGLAAYDILKGLDQKIEDLKAQKGRDREITLLLQRKREITSSAALVQKITIAQKWIEMGYDRNYLISDPDGTTFFVESDFRSLQILKNGKNELSGEDIDLHFRDGTVLFKVQGTWQSFREIQDRIKYDSQNRKFEGWTFVHPIGFIPHDPVLWEELRPYAKLSDKTYTELKAVAKRFWTTSQPEIDPDIPKDCILQVMVLKKHCMIRLVDANGRVYSFGFWVTKQEMEFIKQKTILARLFHSPIFCGLSTANIRLSIPDKSELTTFQADSVSIPISDERFLQIKNKAELINQKGGLRFCATNLNCCRFAEEIIKLGGVQLDTKISLFQFLGMNFPDISTIPYCGRLFRKVSHTISCIYSTVQSSFSIMPKSWRCIAKACFIPRKALTAISSLALLSFGAGIGSESIIKKEPGDPYDIHQKSLISSIGDLFQEKPIYNPQTLRQWIQKQGSYQLFVNSSHSFCTITV